MNNDRLIYTLHQLKNKIVSEQIREGKLVYWQTLDLNKNFSFNETIYNGNAGIILFLIEFNRIFPDDKTGELIRQSVESLYQICKDKNESNFTLLTGRMGVVYIMLLYSKVTSNKEYVNKALELAKACKINFKENKRNELAELLNGNAGTLLGFLILYSFAKEKWVLEQIKQYLKTILNKTEISQNGIYWDKSARQIKPLCGFSHGVSGISYVIDILASISNNQFLNDIAIQGYKYEDSFFNEENNNWPDFRKGGYTHQELTENIKRYKNGETLFFTTPSYMKAWCHGAPGSNFARLSSDRLLKKSNYKEKIDILISEMLQEQIPLSTFPVNLTLCHGLLGNYYFLQEFNKDKNDFQIQTKLDKIVTFSIDNREKFGYYLSGYPSTFSEDQSLFMGNSGIGLFYLAHINNSVINPLNPVSFIKNIDDLKINLSEFNFENFSNIYIQKKFGHLNHHFQFLILQTFKKITAVEFDELFNSSFLKKLIDEMGNANSNQKLPLLIEQKKINLLQNIESHALLNIRRIVNREFILTKTDNEILNSKFRISKTTQIINIENKLHNKMTPLIYYDTESLEVKLIQLNEIEFKVFNEVKNDIKIIKNDVTVSIIKKFLYLNLIYFDMTNENQLI